VIVMFFILAIILMLNHTMNLKIFCYNDNDIFFRGPFWFLTD